MNRTRVKICGVCRVQDAVAAAAAGADAIGLVFHERSARYVSLDVAEQIMAALPPFVTAVGLFVDAPAEQVADTARRLGLGHVQLHGHEPPAAVEAVGRAARVAVLKAVRVQADSLAADLDGWRRAIGDLDLACLRGLVLETPGDVKDSAPGGTGIANDWPTVRRFQDAGAFAGLPPVVAAGGLTPEAVGDVVRMLRPWAVDVSSGVETVKGVKSGEKVRAFIEAVREAGLAGGRTAGVKAVPWPEFENRCYPKRENG